MTGSARDDILVGLRAAAGAAIGDEPPEELLDAYRAEVLREAADFYAELLADIGVEGDSRYWTAVNDVVIGLCRRADGQGKDARPGPQPPAGESTQAAGFFQPGRTYIRGMSARCTCSAYDSGHQADCPLLAVHTCGEPSPCSHVRARLRAEVLHAAADAINALPQDYECDPGRGDAADLLRRMAAATAAGGPDA